MKGFGEILVWDRLGYTMLTALTPFSKSSTLSGKSKFFFENYTIIIDFFSKRNLNKLAEPGNENLNVLARMTKDYGKEHSVPGLQTAFSYLGRQFTVFAWQIEDQDVGAINIHHWGDDKV